MFGILDVGNSNIHFAIISNNNIVDYFIVNCSEGGKISEIMEEKGVTRLVISYVSNKCFKNIPFVEKTEKIILGNEVKKRFKWTYDSMGMDRIANVYYIIKNRGSGIVISLGTMFVIDVIKKGKFLGGLIFPGYSSQIDCVNAKSDFIKLTPYPAKGNDLLAVTTEGAVRSGVYNILVNGITETIDTVAKRFNVHKIVATGGERQISEYLNMEYDKYLTIKGIKLIAEDVYDCSWN